MQSPISHRNRPSLFRQYKRISTQDYRDGRKDNSRCKLRDLFYSSCGLLLAWRRCQCATITESDSWRLGERNFSRCPSDDTAPHASEGSREHLERRAADVHEPSVFSRDANDNQQEFDRLLANIRATQLRSVPGLAPADSGFGPPRSLETEDLTPSPAMGSRPDRLRGPFTIIKISTLIVSIFAVPAAYYFWVGGWNPPPQIASFVPNSMPPPMPPSQAATTIARDDDPGTSAKGEPRTAKSFADESGASRTMPPPKPSSQAATTPAQGEPRTAKSFAGETVATLQPSTPGAQQQDADDLTRLGETAAEYQDRLSRTQGERVAQREAQTPIPAAESARPTVTTDRTAVEAQAPIPAPAVASPTARTDRTTVEAQTPIPPPRPTATTGRTAVAPVSEQSVTPSDQSNADEIVILLKRGQELMRYGDLAAARLVLRHAAEAKNAEAALTLGSTYDPVILRELRVYGLSADVGMARTWYEKAKELGSPEAARRLDNLGH